MRQLARCVGLAFAIAGAPGATANTAPTAQNCTVASTVPQPPPDRPHYALGIRIDRGLKAANGTLSVSFAPPVTTGRIVFRLWPNSPFYSSRGARLAVTAVAIGGTAAPTSRPDPTTLVVSHAVAAGETIRISMRWTLHLPRPPGLQLHGGRSMRLLSFFPLLAWNGTDWATDAPVRTDSFWSTSPTADFDVRVTAPARVQVLGSGERVAPGRWRAGAVRDFALAVGSFRELRTTVNAPRPVRVLVGLEPGSPYRARDFVLAAASALRFYSERYGDYPWTTYSLAVMRDFTGYAGTAYPTLTFLGDGSLALVPHETAHQWFYSLVGNDQSRDPWLSEGLATWAQTGPEHSLPGVLATSIPAAVANRIGEPMSFWQTYDFETIRRGLYVGSAQALAELGDAAAVDCALRRFVVGNAYRTADPVDLLAALRPDFPNAEEMLRARGAHF